MAWGRRRLAGLACVGGTLTLALGIGVATGAQLKPESASVEIASNETASVTAHCKGRQKVVSGGFEQPDFDPKFEKGAFQFYGSRMQGGRGWTSSAASYGDGPGTLISFAYCRKSKRLVERSASVTIPTSMTGGVFESRGITAHCKHRERVVSGGFDVPDFAINQAEVMTYSSFRKGTRRWRVAGVNYDSLPATLTAYAYCREGKAVKTESAFTEIASTGDLGTASARCKRGQTLVGGGFDNADFGEEFLKYPQILPVVSKKSGKRKWTATGYLNSPGEPGTFATYAYCEEK